MKDISYFKYVIAFQKNRLGRDYVYELSTAYLISRSIHVAHQLELAKRIPGTGISIEILVKELSEYSKTAIQELLEFLASYSIFRIIDHVIYTNDLSESLRKIGEGINIEEKEWNSVYDILRYLKDSSRYHQVFSGKVQISDINHRLYLCADNPDDLIRELSSLYLVSRAIRFAAQLNLFDLLAVQKDVNHLVSVEHSEGLEKLLTLLQRYHLLTDSNALTCASIYLTTYHPHSIHPAMFMIDFPWWGAAGKMLIGLQSKTKSAFEEFNQKTFYETYIKAEKSPFPKGMASISLLEDTVVAESLVEKLKTFSTIVDIGGGEGGLLGNLYQLFGNEKNYILFEKQLPDKTKQATETARLQQLAKEKFGQGFNLQVIFGDFTKEEKENNIPKVNQAAYIIKCVLHNIPDQKEIVSILKKVFKKMGENSQLFLAERALPDNGYEPHFNRLSNFLMQLLFKANSRSLQFYITCLKAAGFKMSLDQLDAGNYSIIGGIRRENKPSIFIDKERSRPEPEAVLKEPHIISRL